MTAHEPHSEPSPACGRGQGEGTPQSRPLTPALSPSRGRGSDPLYEAETSLARGDIRLALARLNDAILAAEARFDGDLARYADDIARTRAVAVALKAATPFIKQTGQTTLDELKAAIPFAYTISYPRSGNTMLTQYLAYIFDTPRQSVFPGDGCLFSRNHLPFTWPRAMFVKDHLVRPEYRDDPIVYLVRDGRPAILSFARYLFAQGQLKTVAAGELARFIRWTAEDYWGFWGDNVRRALDARAAGWPIRIVRFEDIAGQPEPLYRLAASLNTHGLTLRTDYAAFKAYEKEQKAKLAIFPEWSEHVAIPDGSFLAPGWTVGGPGAAWERAFDTAARHQFHDLGGTDILLELGYEAESDWWRGS